MAETGPSLPPDLQHAEFLDRLRRYPVGVLVHDLDGRLVTADRHVAEMTGYTPEELLQRSLQDLQDGFNLQEVQRAWTALTPGTCLETVKTFRRKDGVPFQAEVETEAVLDEGRPRIVERVRDLEKKAWIEDYVRSLQDRFTGWVRLIPDLVFRMREDGLILEMFASSQMAVLGQPPQECAGKNIRDVFIGPAIWRILECWNLAAQTRLPQVFDFKFAYGKHVSYYELRCLMGAVDEALFVVRDVSERKSAEQKVNELLFRVYNDNEELRKMAQVKDDFLSQVSHELRTPLTSILGYLRLLIKGSMGEVSEGQMECLEVAFRNANRLYELVNNLLDLSRAQAVSLKLTPERVTASSVLSAAIGSVKNLLDEKRIRLRCDLSEAIDFMADGPKLERVFINILSNAVKFTPAEGEIEAGAKRDRRDGRSGVLFYVKDSGVGIPEKDLTRIFLEFVQVDNTATRKVGGTGLGLAICRKLVELHGGLIWAESWEGQGSTFFVFIPDRLPGEDATNGGAP